MLNYIKLLIKKKFKNFITGWIFFKLNIMDDSIKKFEKKEKENKILLENKIIINNFIKNYQSKNNNNRILLLLLDKVYNNNKDIKYFQNINIKRLNINNIIENKNINFINYINNKINYPNIFIDNYNKKQLINIRKNLFFFFKHDLLLKKKYKKSIIFLKANPKKLNYLESQKALRIDNCFKEYNRVFRYVNVIVPIKKERKKRGFLARLLQKQREMARPKKYTMFFQGRPKIYYFRNLRKINKEQLIEIKKKFPIDFKNYIYEKKRYIKNYKSNIWTNFIYRGYLYKKRIKYNLTAERRRIIKIVNNLRKQDIYRANRVEVLIANKRKKYLPSVYKLPSKKFYPASKIKTLNIITRIIKIKSTKLIRLSRKYQVIASNKRIFKRKYFIYSKYIYEKYWLKGSKHKIILEKEKNISSEYYYIDPIIILLKLKLKNISLNYESFDFISSIIQDKGFSILFYIFVYIPIILCIHYIRKQFYKK